LLILLAPVLPAAAGQLSLSATHNFTIQLTRISDDAVIAPNWGYIRSYVYGHADSNPDEYDNNSIGKTIVNGTPDTAAASFGPYTWLKTNDGAIAYDGGTNFTITHNLVANAPNPGSYAYSYQETDQYFYLHFTVPTDGSYQANLRDVYDLAYSLVQGAGSSNLFISTYGYSYIDGYLSGSTGSADAQKQALDDSRYTWPNSLADFAVTRDDRVARLTLILDDLVAGDTITLYGAVYTYQVGHSQVVPLPGAMLLAGAALLRLAAWRREA
jgi:hypothetical protein